MPEKAAVHIISTFHKANRFDSSKFIYLVWTTTVDADISSDENDQGKLSDICLVRYGQSQLRKFGWNMGQLALYGIDMTNVLSQKPSPGELTPAAL